MFNEILTQLDLSKNEAKIYETLLVEGESPIGIVATKSKINRRNVYDSMNRLIEKGLVFEILQKGENRYKAVDPRKLMEALKEKENALISIMPDLEELYNGKPHEEDVYVYKGIEGWKNLMRDMVTAGEDIYVIGGKGAWANEKLNTARESFMKEVKRKGIKIKVLYDIEIQKTGHKIISLVNDDHRFLPPHGSSTSGVTIFGDKIVVQSNVTVGQIGENTTCTVIINKSIADTFRIWFKLLWDMSKTGK